MRQMTNVVPGLNPTCKSVKQDNLKHFYHDCYLGIVLQEQSTSVIDLELNGICLMPISAKTL